MQNPSQSTLNVAHNNILTTETLKTESLKTYADIIVDYLSALGIEVVFGVPGGAIEPFFDALARSEQRGKMRAVVARHESGAAFMADGYYRETGKIGVVITTTGPGATNLVTGVSSAAVDQIPMLIITAQTALPKFGKRAFQESSCTAIDTVSMLRCCTNFTTLVSHVSQLQTKLNTAILKAYGSPKGPVHMSIPSDVLRQNATYAESREQRWQTEQKPLTQQFQLIDQHCVEQLTDTINRVDSIKVFIGQVSTHASRAIIKFCELVNAPFVTGQMGKSYIDEYHILYRGVYGFAGHLSAKQTLQPKDNELLLVIGSALGEFESSFGDQRLLDHRHIHIDSEREHFSLSPNAELHVLGDIDIIFSHVVARIADLHQRGRRWGAPNIQPRNILGAYVSLRDEDKCQTECAPIKPQRLMMHLNQQLPDSTRIFVDAGNAWSWATHYLLRHNDEGLHRVSMGFGSMAWSIGAAIGSCMGGNKTPTLCLVGDGAYLMSAQEITVALQHQLPVIFLVLNDAALGMVMHGQRIAGAEQTGWEIPPVNFCEMAKSVGVDGLTIEHSSQLNTVNFCEIFKRQQPFLLDVHIDREEIPPMGDRIRSLASNDIARETPKI